MRIVLIHRIFLILFILLGMQQVKVSATEVIWMDTLKSPIATNTVLTRTDPNFLSGLPLGLTFNNTKNYVVFELMRDSTKRMPMAVFQMTANIEVSLWYVGSNPNGAASIVIPESLVLNCDSTSTNISDFRAFRKYSNALKMSIKVLSVTSPQSLSYFPPYRVAMEIYTNKIYPFDCNTTVTTLAATHSPTANRVAFSWNSNSIYADDYDLEWNFYESESNLGKKIQTATATSADLKASFRNNASRISTAKTVDTLAALYRNGYIIYRVRAARYKADGSREYSVWAAPSTVAITLAHESNFNWQSDFTFAEEAKRVAMIKYFDGTLRERQSVTYSIANRTTIASQTIYDYNGRPAVKTMPIPTLSDTIRYYTTLATKINTDITYDKTLFDSLYNCGFSPPLMDTTRYWSRYYSANNPEKTTLKGALIPTSDGFHYTMTEFTQDNTGRIKRQSGVGTTFKIGSGRETKYFYGKPSQEELDRLFGTEVGYASHYQKNMVQDPNGQLSVSYVDAHGRTVATALAGTKPGTLDSVAGLFYKPSITRNILNNVRRGDSLVSMYSLLVTTTGAVKIVYSADTATYRNSCTPSTICYDCQYQARIQITDACSGASSPNAGYTKQLQNFTAGAIIFDTLCSVPAIGIKDSLLLTLTPGEYVVTKILKVHRPAVDYYADNFVKQSNCAPNLTNLKTQMRGTIKGAGCFVNCDSCSNLGTEQQYITTYITSITASGYTLTADDTLAAKLTYRRLVDDCNALCGKYNECESLKAMMMGDMSPGGQYALYKLTNDTTIVALDSTSIFAFGGGATYRYRQVVDTLYKNAFGTRDSILINGVKVSPAVLTPVQFVTYWKPSWAEALVNKHPEYCYYQNCTSRDTCNTFDNALVEIETWSGALAAGVVDSNGVIKNDPCFTNNTALRDSISNWLYVNMVQDPTSCVGTSAIGVINNIVYAQGTEFGKGTRPDNDQAWLILRGMYLGYKYQLKSKWRAAACPSAVCVGNGQAICNGSANIYKDKLPRFQTLDSLSATYTVAGLLAHGAADSIRIKQDCDSTCAQLADAWIQKLAPCNISALTTTQQTTLRNGLIEVCRGGCDQTHAYGASSTKNNVPTASGFTTFESVLTSVIGIKTLCDTCNANLINFPAPYTTPVYMSARNIKKKDDATCVYTTLTTMLATYNALPQTKKDSCYKTFPDYLKLMGDVPLSQKDIDTLIFYYNPSNTSRYLPYDIYIPPYLECNTCKTCTDIQTLLTQFNAACTNTNNYIYWDNFARYANNKLGFVLNGEDYYRFINETCPASPPTGVCVGQKFLCPKSYFGTTQADTSCISALINEADVSAQLRYDAMVDSLREDFKTRYVDRCLQTLEKLTLTDTVWEYHYTLYYYDQAGNLAKTVPPAGLDTLFLWKDRDTAFQTTIKNARINGTVLVPNHIKTSQYAYNSLNKVVVQKTPDADTSKFWYDRIGRTVISRDGRQKPLKRNSYTLRDALGRVIEVGEVIKSGVDSLMTDVVARDPVALNTWLNVTTKEFITKTYYDDSTFYLKKPLGVDRQDNLRNRVVSTTIRKTYNGGVDSLYDFATHYSYDVTGNVKTVIQDIKELQSINQRFKRMDYNYDQLSGKVNAVFYQRDSVDQFTHYYSYDADNRLTTVSTSTQLNTYYRSAPLSIWRFTEATYDYYKHGPLARTELGSMRVQGLDYAYTLQGWLKGVNGILSNPTNDMGQDGLAANTSRKFVGKDAFGYVLNYFKGDYRAAGGSALVTFDPDLNATTAATQSGFYKTANDLFNGNIRSMTVAIKALGNGNANAYAYGYDQLNRLKSMDTYNSTTAGALPVTWTINNAYQERISYDANGNIMKYLRNNNAGARMDSLSYKYYTGTNRLQWIKDTVTTATFTTDIDNQLLTTNYQYDGVGNLVKDSSESLNVVWSPYGKVLSANRINATTNIQTQYGYDAMQNRVLKTFINVSDTTKTYYIRDAQGNTMAVYTRRKDTLVWTEQHLYGSSRLGTWEPNLRLTPSVDTSKKWQVREGQKKYELTNHLGNVLAVVSDRRQGIAAAGVLQYDFYEAVVITATDYYPFGLEMPGRSFQSGSYRFGFNNKENDRISWSATQLVQDYGARLYNPAIGKFLSVDFSFRKYASNSPYSSFSNNPLVFVDPDGNDPILVITKQVTGFAIQRIINMGSGYSWSNNVVIAVPTYKAILYDIDKQGNQKFVTAFNVTRDAYYSRGEDKDGNSVLLNRAFEPAQNSESVTYETVSVEKYRSGGLTPAYILTNSEGTRELLAKPLLNQKNLDGTSIKDDRKDSNKATDVMFHIAGFYDFSFDPHLPDVDRIAASEGCFGFIPKSQIRDTEEKANDYAKSKGKIKSNFFYKGLIDKIQALEKSSKTTLKITVEERSDYTKEKKVTIKNK